MGANLDSDNLQMVEDCINRESKMSAWEYSFIESISGQMDNNRSLSVKQENKLEDIWEKVTSDG